MTAAADQGSLVELPPLNEPCSDTEVLRDRAVDGGADQLLMSELTVPAIDQSDGGSTEGVVEEVLSRDASDELSSDRSRNCSSFRSGSS